MDISKDVSGTLRAEDHGHPPVVIDGKANRKAAGFCTEHSSQSRSIGYEEEKSPTLRAGAVPAAIAPESHPMSCRVKIDSSGVVQSLTAHCGTGGGNAPMVIEPETRKEIKAFGICAKQSYAMLSDNPHTGFYEAKSSRTLDRSGGSPCGNQGGIAVVAFTQNQRNEVRDLNGKSGALSAEPGSKQQTFVMRNRGLGRYNGTAMGRIAHTLDATAGDCVPMVSTLQNPCQNDLQSSGANSALDGADCHAVGNTGSHPSYSVSAGKFTTVSTEMAQTLLARDYKNPQSVNDTEHPEEKLKPEPEYIVRKLTPTECAALQGFPRWWCSNLEIPNPTNEQITFWRDVFETYRLATDPSKKPKTEKQIRKWLASPHTDSAEYRLWGNGVPLPCVYFVMCGIVWAAGLDNEKESGEEIE